MTPGTPSGERPRRFFGWPMLACLSGAELISWGVLYYSFTVFVRPLEHEMGWSRAQVTGAFSAALLVSGLAAVPVGRWLDRHGPRGLMTAGSLIGAALLASFSAVHSLPALYAVWTGIGAAMAMVLYEPAFAVVATWFVRRRDRALTILTVAAGLASTVVVPVATWLVAAQGWRGAALTLALGLACTTVPLHALGLRRSPAAVGQLPDGEPIDVRETPDDLRTGRALRTDRRFWGFTAALTIGSLVTVAATVHAIPYLTGQGVSAARAAGTLGLMGAMQLTGRLVFGSIRRTLTWPWIAALVFALEATALGVLAITTSDAGLVIFASLLGVGNGMATLLRASTLGELCGADRYGRVGGVVALFTTFGRAAGPLLASRAYAASGSYRAVLAELVGLLVLAAAIVLLPLALERPARVANVRSLA